MLKQTIKTNISIIFLFLLAIVSASLLISQYFFSHKVAKDSSEKTFLLISKNIVNQMKNEKEQVNKVLKTNIKNKILFS